MKKNLPLLILSFLILLQGTQVYAIGTTTPTKEAERSMNPNVNTAPTDQTIKEAMAEFKSLSKKAKKDRLQELKKQLRQFKADKKSGAEPSTNTVLLVILAILLPPLAVYLHQGEINGKFWISLLLTLLFFLPGIIYALLVIFGEA